MGENKVKTWFDEDTDILYVSFKKGKSVDSEEKEDGIRLEYDKNRNIIGIEITNITQKLAKPIAKKLSSAIK
jgi:uncharacterized protein YuzE